MRIPLAGLFKPSPFENTLKHAVKVGNCGPLFVEAVESYLQGNRDRFELAKDEIRDIEAECDRIKRNIRAHLPPNILMPVDKSVFFSFLREADKVVDCIKNTLYLMSYANLDFPAEIARGFMLLVRESSDALGFLPEVVERAHKFFVSRTETDRMAVKDIIKEIRFRERESDDLETTLMIRLCADADIPPKTFFLLSKLVETTGSVADHLENSADMIRAMVAR